MTQFSTNETARISLINYLTILNWYILFDQCEVENKTGEFRISLTLPEWKSLNHRWSRFWSCFWASRRDRLLISSTLEPRDTSSMFNKLESFFIVDTQIVSPRSFFYTHTSWLGTHSQYAVSCKNQCPLQMLRVHLHLYWSDLVYTWWWMRNLRAPIPKGDRWHLISQWSAHK